MLSSAELRIVVGTWDVLATDAKMIREAVFIQEQNIAPEDEWDAKDEVSTHFVAYLNDQAVATARLLTSNSIGRVAVLKSARGHKVGQCLMQFVIDYARAESRQFVKLSSQVHAIGFYQALGFQLQGEEYLDCGIPHIDMYLPL
ncbi:GNAT family N-acetyltransferase [Acinetobacter sp. LoGeW2-3]|uniref:GNAT family N-acetyltransferase n=1 Tax=Acinetobacter sp. LoGeW2-3 TaxID=1808001 RepID=UPI000C05AE14|nr:GNAT family N-acetyltransferase [Acinetobacter sp. LoGeW2-3]ATO19634.1 GNAT family N-acetyltransferase [Acinetobacter sp. LoGeW2-3]